MLALVIIIFIAAVIAFVVLIFNKSRQSKKAAESLRHEKEEQQKQLEVEELKLKQALVDKYGEPTFDVNLGHWKYFQYDKHFYVFDAHDIVIIQSKEYNFSDILGYSLEDNSTNETITFSEGSAKTATGSMIGRAVVGGVLTGGLGAVAGAATAKKDISTDAVSTTTTKHNYILYININSLKEPIVTLHIGNNGRKAQELAGILNVIIERNKKTKA